MRDALIVTQRVFQQSLLLVKIRFLETLTRASILRDSTLTALSLSWCCGASYECLGLDHSDGSGIQQRSCIVLCAHIKESRLIKINPEPSTAAYPMTRFVASGRGTPNSIQFHFISFLAYHASRRLANPSDNGGAEASEQWTESESSGKLN